MASRNVEKFKRDLAAAMDEKLEVDVPNALFTIAMEVRDRAEENVLAMLGSKPGAPTLAASFVVAPDLSVEKTEDGKGVSETNRGRMKGADSIFVYSADHNGAFYGYFHENGFYGRAPLQFFASAVASVNNEVVNL